MVKTRPFDAAVYLDTAEAIAAYVAETNEAGTMRARYKELLSLRLAVLNAQLERLNGLSGIYGDHPARGDGLDKSGAGRRDMGRKASNRRSRGRSAGAAGAAAPRAARG